MTDQLAIPPGWGFIDGSSLATPADLVALPDFPEGLPPARQRAEVIAVLISTPALLNGLKPTDLMRRYHLPRNRACEMLVFARLGRIPRQGRRHSYEQRSAA